MAASATRRSRRRPSSSLTRTPPDRAQGSSVAATIAATRRVEVLVVRPPAARRAHEARAREVADDDARLGEPRDERSRRRRPGRRRASRPPGHDLDEAAPAARGSAPPARAARSNAQSGGSSSAARSPASEAGGIQPGSKRAAPVARLEATVGLERGLREVARPGDAQPLRIRDDERARRVGPAEPLLAGDRQEVERRARRRGSRRPTARRRRGSGRRSARAARAPAAGGRSSRAPVRARAAAFAGSRQRGSPPRSGSDDDDSRAGSRASGPSRPKCSSVVVTISSSGPSSRPARTMLQPSVVEPVSATCSGSSADQRGERRAQLAPQREHPLEVRPCRRGRARGRRRAAPRIASTVGRASGPNVPAFRYASRSSTGKSARASSGVIRPSPRPARDRRARAPS